MNKYYILYSKPSCTIISESFVQNRIDAQFYSSEYLTIEKIEFDNGLDYVELGEIGTNFSYGTPPYGHICDKGVPYLRIPDIEDDFFLSDSNIAFIDKEYHLKNIRNEVKAGDVLFRIKGQLGQALVVPQKLSNSHTGSSFLRFTPKSINPYFLVCYLNSSFGRNQINRKQSNSIIQYLNIDDITSIRVPIPSPEIQKYIGDKVRKAEELREEAKRLMGELDNKINNLFNFTYSMSSKGTFVSPNLLDEDRLDSSYYSTDNIEAKKTILKFSNIRKLRDIAYITDGDHGKPEFKENGVLFIRNKNVKKYLINLDDVVYIDRAYEDKYLKSSRLQFEDILLTKIGTIGESAVFLGNEGNLNANSALIRVKDRNLISPYCLCAILNSNIYQLILNKESGGGVQSALSLSRLGEIIVPILDKDIQIEIENMFKLYIDKKETVDKLIQEAKQDVEDLIEGNFDMSKIKANS